MMAQIQTRYIAQLVIENHAKQIEKDWKELEKKAFGKFKEYAKEEVIKKFGKRKADVLSTQFFGYTAHWVVCHCFSKFG